MSDVQLALLILGVIVIVLMLIHNLVQLNKQQAKQKHVALPKTDDSNDPLFNDSGLSNKAKNSQEEGESDIPSENYIKANLPEGIYRDIESVALITTKAVFEGINNLSLTTLAAINGTKIYIRKDNDIWSTDSAIDESVKYNQILVVLLLASRKGVVDEVDSKKFIEYSEEVNKILNGSLMWLANPDILSSAKNLNDFRREVDKSLLLKVFPKTDVSFHAAPLLDFFEKPNVRINNESFHEIHNLENDTLICRLSDLSGKPLEINGSSFVKGIIFKMDVPNTKMITQSFNELVGLIKEFNLKHNAVLVDSGNKQLDEDQISRIYVYLKSIEKKLIERGINPGSEIAKRLFS